MNEKEPPPARFTIPPNLYPCLRPSVGLYKVNFIFCLFLIKFQGTSFSILCHFFLNLSHLFRLFPATPFSKFLILLISFRKLLKDKIRVFWHGIYI